MSADSQTPPSVRVPAAPAGHESAVERRERGGAPELAARGRAGSERRDRVGRWHRGRRRRRHLGPRSDLHGGACRTGCGSRIDGVGGVASVSSQRDSQDALLAQEKRELVESPEQELVELAAIYQAKGLSEAAAGTVAAELTAYDVAPAHLDAELHLDPDDLANPLQAAAASAASFMLGALLPLVAIFAPPSGSAPTAVSDEDRRLLRPWPPIPYPGIVDHVLHVIDNGFNDSVAGEKPRSGRRSSRCAATDASCRL